MVAAAIRDKDRLAGFNGLTIDGHVRDRKDNLWIYTRCVFPGRLGFDHPLRLHGRFDDQAFARFIQQRNSAAKSKTSDFIPAGIQTSASDWLVRCNTAAAAFNAWSKFRLLAFMNYLLRG